MTTHAHDEDARLAALHSYGVLDAPAHRRWTS